MVDCAGCGIFRADRDLRQLHRGRVGRSVVPGGVHNPYRIVRRSFIQIGSEDVAMLGEFAFVPAIAAEPLAGFKCCSALADSAHHVINAGGVAEADLVKFTDTAIGEAAVAVNQAGRGGVSVQIDNSSAIGGASLHVRVRAHGDNLSLADRHGLRDRVLRVDCDDVSVDQHDVAVGDRAAAGRRCAAALARHEQHSDARDDGDAQLLDRRGQLAQAGLAAHAAIQAAEQCPELGLDMHKIWRESVHGLPKVPR